MSEKILLTGATGFIGQRFLEFNAGRFEMATVSFSKTDCSCGIDFYEVKTVLHLAGIAHQMQKIDDQIYFDVNHKKTLELADEAKKMGVRQFIFVSSVKVFGEETSEKSLDENSPTDPQDAYGRSKLAAENDLLKMADENFRVAIVRPPLVYGPRVKGNMLKLLQLLEKAKAVPFAGINNRRSMVFVDNLIALFNKIIEKRASGIFIAGDAEPISTSELVVFMAKYSQKSTRNLKIPTFIIKILTLVRPSFVRRLYGSFVVDNSITNEKLGFSPPFSTEFGIEKMVEWYLNLKNK